MSIYKTIESKGVIRYMKDGKFTAKDSIPTDALMKLVGSSEIKYSGCIFCSKEGTRQRLITGVMVHLCDDDYYTQTVGNIVHQLNQEEPA